MKSKDLENKIKEYEIAILKLKGEITYLSSKTVNLEIENNYLKQRNERLIKKIGDVKYYLRSSINSIDSKIQNNRNNYHTNRINDYRLVRLRAFRQKSKEILKMLGGV